MKKLLPCLLGVFALGGASVASAEEVKLGVLLGFTGPLESVAGDIASGAELAIEEVSASDALLNGSKVMSKRGDSTCVDAGAATTAADRLISSEGVNAIVGAMCSGATTAVLQNVAMPKGIVMISPSATSPALSSVEDNGLFFRAAPSDARQGEIIAHILNDRGVKEAALTYTNNDYGKGLSDSITSSFEALGGKITINAAHEDGKGDYSAEVAALSAAGGEVLIVAGYQDQGGKGIIQSALDVDAFDTFVLPDGMMGDPIIEAIGDDLNGSYGVLTGNESKGGEIFATMAADNGFKVGPYAGEAYDAAALILLAMQAAGSSKSEDLKAHIMSVANAPGEKILPGDLKRGLEIIASGGDVDYVGASAIELIEPGESSGNFREITVEGGKQVTTSFR